jgi:hypothetical protein
MFNFEHNKLQNKCLYNVLYQLKFKYFWTLHTKDPIVIKHESNLKILDISTEHNTTNVRFNIVPITHDYIQ